MADVTFTAADEELSEALLEEFDPAKRLSRSIVSDLMSADDWAFVLDCVREDLRVTVRCALITRAIVPESEDPMPLFQAIESALDEGPFTYESDTYRRWSQVNGRLGAESDALSDDHWQLRTEILRRLSIIEGWEFKPIYHGPLREAAQ